MIIKTISDLKHLQIIGNIVATTLAEMISAVKPGMSTLQLDQYGGNILQKKGALSAPKYVYNFPGNTCISINDNIAHGIPSERIIKEGDIVNIDVSALKNGYYADSGYSIIIGEATYAQQRLCNCSKEALQKAIQNCKADMPLNQIGKTIESTASQAGYTVIKNLSGHGTGQHLHEQPYNILNFFRKTDQQRLTAGQVIAVETFVSAGATYVTQVGEWELYTPQGELAPQYEQTIIITEQEPLILTKFYD